MLFILSKNRPREHLLFEQKVDKISVLLYNLYSYPLQLSLQLEVTVLPANELIQAIRSNRDRIAHSLIRNMWNDLNRAMVLCFQLSLLDKSDLDRSMQRGPRRLYRTLVHNVRDQFSQITPEKFLETAHAYRPWYCTG